MNELRTAAFAFPTVVFTVALLVCAGYWTIAIIGGFGLDVDSDVDAGGDLDGGAGLLDALGLAAVPPAVAVSLVTAFAWLVSVTASALLPDDPAGAAGAALALGVAGLAAFAVGVVAAGLAARPLRPLYETVPPVRAADMVGRLCRIRSVTATETTGQAAVTDREGAEMIIRVRARPGQRFARNDTALVIAHDPDAGVFTVDDPDGLELP